MQPIEVPQFGRRAKRRALPLALVRPSWKSAGVLALLCSGVAWASFPRMSYAPVDDQHQWQALGVAPLSGGGATGMPMAPTDAVQAVDFVPKRAVSFQALVAAPKSVPVPTGPLRIRGRVGDGLYWSLRAAGAS